MNRMIAGMQGKDAPLSKLHKDLWKVFSEYIRLSEADINGHCRCISCGVIRFWKRIDAGHFISRGHKYLLYDERNVHPQCGGCNSFKQGNYADYRKAMILKYGEAVVNELEERKNWPANFTKEGLVLRIKEYREKVKVLKKQKDVQEF